MNIVSLATNKKGWSKSSISFIHDRKKIEFIIYHNMVTEGNINSISAAVENWYLRTRKYNQQSFIDYVNSKKAYKALNEEDFNKL